MRSDTIMAAMYYLATKTSYYYLFKTRGHGGYIQMLVCDNEVVSVLEGQKDHTPNSLAKDIMEYVNGL